MVKEDRSDWVAVAPEHQASDQATIKPAASAYLIFQKDITPHIRVQLQATLGTFDVGQFSRAVRDRWSALDPSQKAHYEAMAREDASRFARESHAADVAALERQRRLQQDRHELILDDEDGDLGRRSTRGALHKKQRKKERREKKASSRKENSGSDSHSDDSYDGSDSSSVLDDTSDDERPMSKKAPPRQMSKVMKERKERMKMEKVEKEQYIAKRQDDLRKDRSAQAKRRLDFLLAQSDIFKHFGQVKEDKAKYGGKAIVSPRGEAGAQRRSTIEADSAEADAADAADLEEERSATYLTSQPATLGHGKMRDYQLEGLNWMIRLQENGVNGILADEMGLGKTLQSISILVYMMEIQESDGPHLIVVPKSTLSNWMNELKRWAPTVTAVKFHGTKEERDEIRSTEMEPAQRDENRTWNVCVTTYEVCNIEKTVLNKLAWEYLIIDEAHRLKNEQSAFSRTIRTFETRYRLLLTGTPLQNNLHELWALLNFLVPDVFANAEQFDEWFNLDIDDADEKNKLISQLHKILRPFMLRRLKKEVEASLPAKRETILFTGMSSMQKKLYRDILLRDIDILRGGGGGGGSRTQVLNIVMQLRKCAGHPYLFPGVEDRSLPPLGEHLIENCGKMVLLDKLLRRLKERGHRVLLFTQMTRILDILEDYLVYRHYKYCRIDGNTSYEVREEHIDAFNAPKSEKFLFLLSTRAGGLGINLQTADVVILYDSDWNPQADLQAQDRAHRIGQKKEVQVFRFVTEHTIEEKIVERAQQKLKLDAMVVQSGRLKEKDKLSSDELLDAVRFGADKVFKSKDSSITDDDIDIILDFGKRKTQEMTEKLKDAEKGDLLDFKLDGGISAQTYEGIDYSLAKAAQEEMFIMDIGKRERRAVANYNENSLYQQQIAALHGGAKKERRKTKVRLPKSLRLPRMEDWQMYDRPALLKLQEEEEAAFRSLPDEQQKMAAMKPSDDLEGEDQPCIEALPPLLNDEKQARKMALLAEGFADWGRQHFTAFVKGSAKFGKHNLDKIAKEVGKPLVQVKAFASAFWDESIGMKRISEHEYDRVVKLINRGEKRIEEIRRLENGTRILLSLFDNPWQELEYTHVNCKDKMFTAEEDRYLLCWTHKFGYGQWDAVKMAIRRNPNFRFDYFLRSVPTEVIGRRCEALMKSAEKEVEHLISSITESNANGDGTEAVAVDVTAVDIPMFKVLRARRRAAAEQAEDAERASLQSKVDVIEDQMRKLQDRLRVLNQHSRETSATELAAEFPDELIPVLANRVATSGAASIVSIANTFTRDYPGRVSKNKICSKLSEIAVKEKREAEGDTKPIWYVRPDFEDLLDVDTLQHLRELKGEKQKDAVERRTSESGRPEQAGKTAGAVGPDGEFVEFPSYDGKEPPRDSKRAFTHFCNGTRKAVKKSLDSELRKDKHKVNSILKERWFSLSEQEKLTWKAWERWDRKRHARDQVIFERATQRKNTLVSGDKMEKSQSTAGETSPPSHMPEKRKGSIDVGVDLHVPKKKRAS